MKGNKPRQHYLIIVNTVFYGFFSPQTPSLVVQSTVRSFPQVTPLFHKLILLEDLPQSHKLASYLCLTPSQPVRLSQGDYRVTRQKIFNLKSEYHSQHNSNGKKNVRSSSNRKLNFIKTYNNSKQNNQANQASLPSSSTRVASTIVSCDLQSRPWMRLYFGLPIAN